MNEVFYRLLGTAIMISLGMHGIKFGMEANGALNMRNPAWWLIRGYFDLEMAVLIAGAILAAVAGVLYLLSQIEWPKSDHKIDDEEAIRKSRISNMQESLRRTHAKWQAEDDAELATYRREAGETNANVHKSSGQMPSATEDASQKIHIEVSRPPKLNPEELKRKAINQLFRE